MDEEYDEEETYATPSRPFSLLDLAITSLSAVSGYIDGVVRLMALHANYKVDRRTMENEARAEIEAMVNGL